MLDPNGYYELVIHPPPLNFITFILIPFMVKGSIMKKASKCFSKFVFWCENTGYIMCFLFGELLLVPFIYCKVTYNICIICGLK